jgi:hypothetical protein
MPSDLLFCLLLFPVVTFGLAWPLASRLALDPGEKLCATAMLSLLGAYLLAFASYHLGLPPRACWGLPALAAAGLIAQRRELARVLRDPEVRALLGGQVIVAVWCLGWLSFVVSYSGDGWTGDWLEHWQRTRFFVEHQPLDTKFIAFYPLPARPPLANLVTGAMLGPTGVTFPAYQLVTTLLNCLAFLPAGLLVRRFHLAVAGTQGESTRVAIGIFTLLVMLNPSFVENSTFAWTKLITAFFVLNGLYFFLRANDPSPAPAAAFLCPVGLAAAVLTHYSAGPYVVLLAAAWFGVNHHRWQDPSFWRITAGQCLIGGAVLATWFGWSFATYGLGATLFANTGIAAPGPPAASQLLRIALNLRDTLLPHFLHTVDPELIAQASPWGYWRDWFFQLYQLNLLFIFGSVAWLVILRELLRAWPLAPSRNRWFWTIFLGGVIVLGVAVVGGRNPWGFASICLQALMVLGLAYIAARWDSLGRGWQLALMAGTSFDFLAGIALQFGVQSYAFDHWFTPERTPVETAASYTFYARMNLSGKLHAQLDFFGDVVRAPGGLVFALMVAILTLAVARAARLPD